MSDTNGPAFPTTPESAERLGCTFTHEDVGLTKRDWFAGQALVGLVDPAWVTDIEHSVEYAYRIADAMLIERAK